MPQSSAVRGISEQALTTGVWSGVERNGMDTEARLGACVNPGWSRDRGALIRYRKCQMRLGFEKLEKEI